MVHSAKQVDPWSPSRLQWAVGNTGKTFSINSFSYPISGLVPTPHFFIMHDKTRVFWQGQTRRIRDYKWHSQRHIISKRVAIPESGCRQLGERRMRWSGKILGAEEGRLRTEHHLLRAGVCRRSRQQRAHCSTSRAAPSRGAPTD